MRQNLGVVGATLIAALAPAIYFGICDQALWVGVLAFVLASLWIVLLGLPAFFFLKCRGWFRWWSAIACGFFLGTVPAALITWPYDPSGRSGYSAWDGHKMVDYVVRGVPTRAGWLQFFHGSCTAGLLGAASAITFWVVWRLIVGPGQSSKRTRVPGVA